MQRPSATERNGSAEEPATLQPMIRQRPEWRVRLTRSNYRNQQEATYFPRVIVPQTLTLEQLIARMTQTRACSLDAQTLRAAAGMLADAVEEHIVQGYAVSTPLGTLTPALTGTWDFERQQPEARAKNSATVRYTPGTRLKKRLANPLLHAVDTSPNRTAVYDIEDHVSATRNERLTPGGLVTLHGQMLLMNGDLPTRGVYLLRADEADEETATLPEEEPAVVLHLTPGQIAINTRSRISFQLPADTPPGRYRLRVVSQCTTNNRPLKQAVEYTTKGTVTVE